MSKRYFCFIEKENSKIVYYDQKLNKELKPNEIEEILNAYNDMLEQAEAIKAKMNESWLLKKFIKK